MKLAEALAERSDCQIKIDEIKKRLIRSARVQEGEQPAEDTTELLAESERVFARLLELVSAINRTNSKTAFDTELTISDAIAERDVVGTCEDHTDSDSDSIIEQHHDDPAFDSDDLGRRRLIRLLHRRALLWSSRFRCRAHRPRL